MIVYEPKKLHQKAQQKGKTHSRRTNHAKHCKPISCYREVNKKYYILPTVAHHKADVPLSNYIVSVKAYKVFVLLIIIFGAKILSFI